MSSYINSARNRYAAHNKIMKNINSMSTIHYTPIIYPIL